MCLIYQKTKRIFLINDSQVSAAIFREWQIGLWTFVSRHYFWEVWRWKICKQKVKRATKLSLKETLRKKRIDMVRKDRCVGICNNDRCYADKLEIKSHVKILKWHRFPEEKVKHKWWETEEYPNPTLLLTVQDNKQWFLVFLWLCFFSDQKALPTIPAISHTNQSIV